MTIGFIYLFLELVRPKPVIKIAARSDILLKYLYFHRKRPPVNKYSSNPKNNRIVHDTFSILYTVGQRRLQRGKLSSTPRMISKLAVISRACFPRLSKISHNYSPRSCRRFLETNTRGKVGK